MSTWPPPPPDDRPEGGVPAGPPPSAPPPPPGPGWLPPPPPPGWGGPPTSAPAGYGPPPFAAPAMNPLCIASLSMGGVGIIGAFCCFVFGIPLGLAAIVTGIIGLTQVRDGSEQGKGMAIGGICCGVAAAFLPVVFLLLSFGVGAY